MVVPNDVIIIWTGSRLTIPTGYIRETSLDGYYIQGCSSSSTSGGGIGGTATHTHTCPSHSHTFSSDMSNSSRTYKIKGEKSANTNHYHPLTSTVSSTITVQTADNDPINYPTPGGPHTAYYSNLVSCSNPSAATTNMSQANYDKLQSNDDNRFHQSTRVDDVGCKYTRYVFNMSADPINYNDSEINNITYLLQGYYNGGGSGCYERIQFKNSSGWYTSHDIHYTPYVEDDADHTKSFTTDIDEVIDSNNLFQFGTAIYDSMGTLHIDLYIDWVRLIVVYTIHPPTYGDHWTNTTLVGQPCEFKLEWDDNVALHPAGQYKFSTNNTGHWENSTWTAFSSTPQNATNVTILNSTPGTVVAWCFYANDSSGNMNGTNCQPGNYFTLITANSFVATDFIEVKVRRGWMNDTWTNDGGQFTGTTAWSNVTKIVNESAGRTICWRVYANDTSNNWNVSDVFSYTVKGDPTLNMHIAINGTQQDQTKIYPNVTNVTAWETNDNDEGCTYNLYRNGQLVSGNSETILLGVGNYTYVYNTSGCNNYLAGSVTRTLNITKGTPTLNLFINDQANNVTINWTEIPTIKGNESNWVDTDLNYSLWMKNGTSIELLNSTISDTQSTEISYTNQLANGTYEFWYNTSGGQNYTQGASTHYFLFVNKKWNQTDSVYAGEQYEYDLNALGMPITKHVYDWQQDTSKQSNLTTQFIYQIINGTNNGTAYGVEPTNFTNVKVTFTCPTGFECNYTSPINIGTVASGDNWQVVIGAWGNNLTVTKSGWRQDLSKQSNLTVQYTNESLNITNNYPFALTNVAYSDSDFDSPVQSTCSGGSGTITSLATGLNAEIVTKSCYGDNLTETFYPWEQDPNFTQTTTQQKIRSNVTVTNGLSIPFTNVSWINDTLPGGSTLTCSECSGDFDISASGTKSWFRNATGDALQESKGPWRQDNTRTTLANGTAYITQQFNISSTVGIDLTNVDVTQNVTARSGWNCPENITSINIANGSSLVVDQAINCSAPNIIQPVNTSDWVQDTSKTTVAGGYVYIKGKSYFNNTDTLVSYTNVVANGSSYFNETLRRDSSWLCSWNSSFEQTDLSFGSGQAVQVSGYSVLCNKSNVITKNESAWQADNSTEQNISYQKIIKKLNGTNTDTLVSYTNVNASYTEKSGYGNYNDTNPFVISSIPASGTWERWISATNTSAIIITTWTNKYLAPEFYQNITINDTGDITFYNLTAWSNNFDDTNITAGTEYIKYLNGSNWINLNTGSLQSNCNTSNPTYTATAVSGVGNFYVCMQDTNANGKGDYFKFKIPHTSTETLQVGGSDTSPPQYTISANINYSYPKPGEYIKLYSKWQDDVELSWYIFEWDASGNFENVTNGTLSGSEDWANVTLQIPTDRKASDVISYRFYVNDSSNNWNSSNNTFTVWGWSNVTEIKVANLFDTNKLNRSITPITCRVLDANTSEAITNYPVKFWKNDTLLGTNYTNSSGYAIWYWNTAGESAGSYSIKCNITDNTTLYYNVSSPNENTTTVGISAALSIDQIIKQHDEIYRNDTFSPYSSLITVHVIEAALGDSSGANVSFYNHTSFIDSCLTNSTGYCNISFNPGDNVQPQNLTLYINATKSGFSPSSTKQTWIVIKGKLFISMDSPQPGYTIHKGIPVDFHSTVRDENWNYSIQPEIKWYNSSWYLIAIGKDNTTAIFPVDHPLGGAAIYVNASKQFYDSDSDNHGVIIHGWSNVSLLEPNDGNITRGSIINILCRVLDANTSSGIGNYPVKFWRDSSNIYNGITNSTPDGYANYSWNTTGVAVGQHKLNCTITSNSTLFYDTSISNSYTQVNIIGNLTAILESVSEETIYRNNSFSPKESNLTVRIIDEYSNGVSNSLVKFYQNESYLGNCTTNSTGYCTFIYNPQDSLIPGNYSIKFNATKDYYYSSNTVETFITVKGKLGITIESPAANTKSHRGDTIQLNSTVRDENGNSVAGATVSWYNSTKDLLATATSPANTTWTIPYDYTLGTETLNATVTKQFYDSASDTTSIEVWRWVEVNITSPENQSSYSLGTLVNITCRVLDSNTSQPVSDYLVDTYIDNELKDSALTNSTGYTNYTWNTTTEAAGSHTIKCNITDNTTLYYNASVKEYEIIVNLTSGLWIDNITTQYTSVYRNNSFSPSSTNITVHVRDEAYNSIEGSNVTFYNSTNLLGYCLTNSTGYCYYEYNPPETLTPQQVTIFANATKPNYIDSSTVNINVNVTGKLYPTIICPLSQKFYRNDTIQLNSITKDENNNFVTPDVANWTLSGESIGSGENTTWQVPINHAIGNFTLNYSVQKNYYDSGYTTTDMPIWSKANVTLYSPLDASYDRGSSITYYANVTDYYNNSAIQGYNCSWWLDNNYLGSSITNENGTCSWTWITSCSNFTRDYIGLHKINSTIKSNSSIFYDTKINNSYTSTILKGFLKIRIEYPINNTIWYKTETQWLNSSVEDECSQPISSPTVNWTLNNTEYLNTGVNTTWEISSTHERGKFFVNATANKTNYHSTFNTSYIFIYGWSNVTELQPSGSYNKGVLINVSCHVRDANSSTDVSNYPVNFYTNDTLRKTSLTNSSGIAVWQWNTSTEDAGYYNIKCNISDNSTLYYNSSTPKEQTTGITIIGKLYINEIKRSYNEIYRNDTFSPSSSLITVHVIEGALGDSSGANCTFYNSTDYLGSSLTNSSGYCTFNFNPQDKITPQNYSIYINATKSGWTESDTNQTWLIIKGKTYINILTPVEGQILYKTRSVLLNSTTKDENNIIITPDNVSWYLNSTQIATGENTSFIVPYNNQVGYYLINATATKQFYDWSNSTIDVSVYGFSNISYLEPLGDQPYGVILKINCSVRDANDSSKINNYPVKFYSNESFIGENFTEDGFAILYYQPPEPGTYTIKCNITDNATLYYNASIRNASGEINVTDLIPPNISASFTPDILEARYEQVQINATATDDFQVSKVWANITLPNGSREILIMSNYSSNNYSVNYTPLIGGNYSLYVYANDTSNNLNSTYLGNFTVKGHTNFTLDISPTQLTATGITLDTPYRFNLTVIANNIKNVTARFVNITLSFQSGFVSNSTFESCGNLTAYTNCTKGFEITINNSVTPGGPYYVTSKVEWENPDGSVSAKSNSTSITVESNPFIKVEESAIVTSIQHNESKDLTDVLTLNSTGNTVSHNIIFNFTRITIPESWSLLFHDPSSPVYTLQKNEIAKPDLYIQPAIGQDPGLYYGNITVYSDDKDGNSVLRKWLWLNITVLENRTWSRTPSEFPMTTVELGSPPVEIGKISVNNTGNVNLTFSISRSGVCGDDISTTPSESIFVPKQSTKNITVTYEGTGSSGTCQAIVSITNSSATPTQLNTTINLNITNLPPIIENESISPENPEVNKEAITILADVYDAAPGIDEVWANVTLPDGGFEILKMKKFDVINYPNRYRNNTYIPTQVGYHLVKVYANDTDGAKSFVQLNFTSVANTTIKVISEDRTVSGITQTQSNTTQLNVTLDNFGIGRAYETNVSFILPSGWSTSPNILYYGTIQKQTQVSNQTTLTVPSTTPPGNYQITIRANWTNADNSLGTNTTQIVVTVTSNPILDIVQSSVLMITQHGRFNSTNITLNATGNDNVTNIQMNCSGIVCTDFNISFEPQFISLLPSGSSIDVNISYTVPVGYTPGVYIAGINATGNVNDSMTLQITVPQNKSWTRQPQSLTATAGVNNVGDFGIINITNIGNLPLTFNLGVTGNITSYVNLNSTSVKVQKQTSGYVKATYNATQIGTFTGNVTITNSSATPTQQNVSLTLEVINFTVDITSPNSTSPLTDLYAGNITPVTVYAQSEGNPLTENITWQITINNTECQIIPGNISTENNYWKINCSAPSLPDGKSYTLKVIGNYTTYNAIASDSELNAIKYKDITPPVIENITANSVKQGNNVTIDTNVNDNVKVVKAIVEVSYPNSTKTNFTMINVTSTKYQYNFTDTNTIGDYDYRVFIWDAENNSNSSSSWFEVYNEISFSGTTKDNLGNPIKTNFEFYRPDKPKTSLYLIHNFTSNKTTGEFNQTLHNRTYDTIMKFYKDEINFKYLVTNHNIQEDIVIGNISSTQAGEIPGAKVKIRGIALNMSFNFTNATITLDYSSFLDSIDIEDNIKIYRCENWDFNDWKCNSGWANLSSSVDKINHKVSAVITGFSAYFVAESGAVTTTTTTPYTPTGPTGGPTGPTGNVSVCGNGVCELGENWQNCPADCPPTIKPIQFSTTSIEVTLSPGEYRIISLGITNNLNKKVTANLSVEGRVWEFVQFEKPSVEIEKGDTEYVLVKLFTLSSTPLGVYIGNIVVKAGNVTSKIPVTLKVEAKAKPLLDINLDVLTPQLLPGETLQLRTTIFTFGEVKTVDVTINYTIEKAEVAEKILTTGDTVAVDRRLEYTKSIKLPEDIKEGRYLVEAYAFYDNRTASAIVSFKVYKELLIVTVLKNLFTNWITYVVIAVIIISYFGYREYSIWKITTKAKSKYVFPVDFKKLPKGVKVGKIAETNINAYWDLDKLTQHMIIAGGTGSGKTVAAMVIAEEALKKGIPCIVFDPTAQWTGFVRACRDKHMLDLYPKFGLKPEDARAFKGNIIDVTDPNMPINIRNYTSEGEITVFCLTKLTPTQLDTFVTRTIDEIFKIPWEESRKLKLLVIYDEVHRLLPKYGGVKGYRALERGVREFRKWGIGLIMISQVLLDFKGAIRAVIASEAQMRTKYSGDVNRVKSKYGSTYAVTLPKLKIGTGMVQNPEYNDGRPWFIEFRPLLHDTSRIPERELKLYKKYQEELAEIERIVENMKKKGIDTYDIEMEIKLAKEKIKQAQFRMAETYLESLKARIRKGG